MNFLPVSKEDHWILTQTLWTSYSQTSLKKYNENFVAGDRSDERGIYTQATVLKSIRAWSFHENRHPKWVKWNLLPVTTMTTGYSFLLINASLILDGRLFPDLKLNKKRKIMSWNIIVAKPVWRSTIGALVVAGAMRSGSGSQSIRETSEVSAKIISIALPPTSSAVTVNILNFGKNNFRPQRYNAITASIFILFHFFFCYFKRKIIIRPLFWPTMTIWWFIWWYTGPLYCAVFHPELQPSFTHILYN